MMKSKTQGQVSKDGLIGLSKRDAIDRAGRREAAIRHRNILNNNARVGFDHVIPLPASATKNCKTSRKLDGNTHQQNEPHGRNNLTTWVLLILFAEMTGYSPGALRKKIERKEWAEGVHYLRSPDGRIHINIRAYTIWLQCKK